MYLILYEENVFICQREIEIESQRIKLSDTRFRVLLKKYK